MTDTRMNTLLTILKTGSFTQAAKALNLTQPAVSHQIHSLEEEYHIRIFYPETRKLTLTPEGRLVEKYAKQLQRLHSGFLRELEESLQGERPFKIGLTPTAENSLVPLVIARYCAEHKDVRLSILSDTIKKIHTRLEKRELDFAIIEGSISDPDLVSRRLDVDDLCLILSPEHPMSSRSGVTIEEIRQLPLIMRPRSAGTRQLFEAYLDAHNEQRKHFRIIMEIDNVNAIKELVISNLGASVAARSSCVAEALQGRLKILPISDFSSFSREINIIYHRDFAHLQMINELCEIYKQSRI